MKVAITGKEQSDLYGAIDDFLQAKEYYDSIRKDLAQIYDVKAKTIKIDSFDPFMYAEAK